MGARRRNRDQECRYCCEKWPNYENKDKNSAIVYPIEYRQASGRYSSGNSTEYLADDPLSIGERSTGSQLLINLRKHQNQAADLFSGLIAILR